MATTGRAAGGFAGRVDDLMRVILRHWLLAVNLANGLTLGGAILTPLIQARGWTIPATLLYLAYRPLCPQRPDHSYFIAGHKMAFEQRETAIYVGLTLGGLLFALFRRRLRSPGWRVLAVASVPLLVDVFSQTVGLRESDWWWRTVTSLPFALAVVWWAYPHLEREFHGAPEPPRARRTTEELARAIVLANPAPPLGEDAR
jgi:uncharacterized membrane protein